MYTLGVRVSGKRRENGDRLALSSTEGLLLASCVITEVSPGVILRELAPKEAIGVECCQHFRGVQARVAVLANEPLGGEDAEGVDDRVFHDVHYTRVGVQGQVVFLSFP